MPNRQIIRKNDDKMGIIGSNILINGNEISAYYILNSNNYSIMNENGVNQSINILEKMIESLAMKYPELEFSILKINKPTSAFDVRNNLLDTIHLWDENYIDIPPIFKRNITQYDTDYCLLRIQIDNKDLGNIEQMSTKELLKSMINQAANSFSFKKVNLDFNRIKNIEEGFFDIIRNYGMRASKGLVYYTYISSLFPSYEITYNNNSYISNKMSDIIGYLNQEMISKFGYFKMTNPGIEMLGLESQESFGCILTINKLPNTINTDNFNLSIPGLRVNFKLIPKKKARLMIKRSRSDLEFEQETALEVGVRDLDDLEDNLELADIALKQINSGKLLCEMSINILIIANDLKTLNQEKQEIISKLADSDIIASISLDQVRDFINNYVKGTCKKYEHLCDLRVPLSFQLNNCPIVGDMDSKYNAPKIGNTL